MVHRIVLGRYAEHFCFLFSTLIAQIEKCSFDMLLSTEVIEKGIPSLLSKDTVKKANTYIDFAND